MTGKPEKLGLITGILTGKGAFHAHDHGTDPQQGQNDKRCIKHNGPPCSFAELANIRTISYSKIPERIRPPPSRRQRLD